MDELVAILIAFLFDTGLLVGGSYSLWVGTHNWGIVVGAALLALYAKADVRVRCE